MCRSKMAVDAAEPKLSPAARTSLRSPRTPRPPTPSAPRNPSPFDPSTSNISSGNYSSGSSSYRLNSSTATATAAASISSRTSLSSLRGSLSENPHIYDFSEIRSATNNFLAKRYSSSSSSPSWRCSLRGKDVIVFQRKFRRSIKTSELRAKLSVICRSHHMSIIKLLGASISGDYIYLVYEFTQGGNLADCLRNKRNPDFTPLDTWMSRMQIATDLASGLDYIHNNANLNINLVHKYVKSSSVIVTEPSFNAKICHFGTAELCGETEVEHVNITKTEKFGEITEESPEPDSPLAAKVTRSDSRMMQFEGVKGYMSPEFRGHATQKSDVYAFGVVILELLSGEEPVRYKYDKKSGDHVKILVVETARAAVDGGEGEVSGRLRRWVDKRLRDSFPVEVAEKLTRIALECVDEDPNKRPNIGRVAGKISKLYLDSRKWADTVRIPVEISASFAPR